MSESKTEQIKEKMEKHKSSVELEIMNWIKENNDKKTLITKERKNIFQKNET